MAKQPLKHNLRFSNPTPYELRHLVLDYLCHNCYTATAEAFGRDCTVRHLDADGDEITFHDSTINEDDSVHLSDDTLRLMDLRDGVRELILSGQIEAAVQLLNTHFPTVLSETAAATAPTPGPHTSPDEIEYLAPTSVDPAHLNLNLRIAAFTEASRTIPLPYPGSALEPPEPPCIARPDEPADMTGHQVDLLSRAQKLYTSANMLPKPSDRVKYLDELAHISGLLAYRTPEESPMALYLSQARREAVAEQINSAILYRTGLPAISYMELYTRYTSSIWTVLNDLRVKSSSIGTRPPGVQLPPNQNCSVEDSKGVSEERSESKIVSPFNLNQFLNSKT